MKIKLNKPKSPLVPISNLSPGEVFLSNADNSLYLRTSCEGPGNYYVMKSGNGKQKFIGCIGLTNGGIYYRPGSMMVKPIYGTFVEDRII